MEQYMFQLELKGEGVCRSRNSIRAYRYTSTCIFTNHIYHSYPDMIFNQFKPNMYITLSSVLGNLSSSSLYQLSKMFETFFISNIKQNLIFWQKKGLQTELPTPSLDLPIIMYMYQYQANLSTVVRCISHHGTCFINFLVNFTVSLSSDWPIKR